jgi:hypothetical protein
MMTEWVTTSLGSSSSSTANTAMPEHDGERLFFTF